MVRRGYLVALGNHLYKQHNVLTLILIRFLLEMHIFNIQLSYGKQSIKFLNIDRL